MSHGYLGAQFFSPMTNLRDDEYDLEHGLRFAREVLRPSARRAGDRVAVGVRLAADEGPTGALGPAACARDRPRPLRRRAGRLRRSRARLLADADGLGRHRAAAAGRAQRDRRAGRRRPRRAARRADDRHHPRGRPRRCRAAAGRRADRRDRHDAGDDRRPRPDLEGRRAAAPTRCCTASAATRAASATTTRARRSPASSTRAPGRERTLPRPVPGSSSRDVLVIGGGPAGIAAAIEAARSGDRVTLLERDRRPRRPAAAGRPRAGAHRDVAGLRGRRPARPGRGRGRRAARHRCDHRRRRRPRPGGRRHRRAAVHVRRSRRACRSACCRRGRRSPTPAPSRGRSLVADWGGGYEGLDAAELLAAAGCDVELASGGVMPGEDVHQYQRNLYLARLDTAGVRIRHHLELTADGRGCVTSSRAGRRRSARSRRWSWPRAARPTTSCGARSRAGRASCGRATCSVRDRPRRRFSKARSRCGRLIAWGSSGEGER